jgi:hypothetical protein
MKSAIVLAEELNFGRATSALRGSIARQRIASQIGVD